MFKIQWTESRLSLGPLRTMAALIELEEELIQYAQDTVEMFEQAFN